LRNELWNRNSSVVSSLSGSKRSESNQEEVETRERNEIDGQLSKIRVELSRESEAACNSTHNGRDQMIQVSICGGCEFEGSETDIVEGFVINAHDFVSVFDQLVDGEGSIIGFNDGIRDFRGWDHRKRAHHSIGVFFTDFA